MKYVCEICGRRTDKIYTIVVDGAILHVCEECKKYGKEVTVSFGKIEEKKVPKKTVVGFEEEIVDNYYILIRQAREKLGISQKDAARLLGIKEATYKSIEEGKIKPDLNLAKKIEKAFNIKITQKVALFEEGEAKQGYLTVADIIEFEED